MWVTSWVGVVLIALCPIWNICNAEQSLTDILLRFDDLSEVRKKKFSFFMSLIYLKSFLSVHIYELATRYVRILGSDAKNVTK